MADYTLEELLAEKKRRQIEAQNQQQENNGYSLKDLLAEKERRSSMGQNLYSPEQLREQATNQDNGFLRNLAQNLKEYGKRVYEESPDFMRQSPSRVFKKVGQTVAEGARGLVNLPANIQERVFAEVRPKTFENPRQQALYDKLTESLTLPKVPEKNIGRQLGVEGYQPGDIISETIPYLVAPELAETKSSALLPRLLARSATGATYGAAASPADMRQAAIAGSILGGAGEVPTAIKSVGNIGKAIKEAPTNIPARLLRGNATPAELAKNLEIAGDLPFNIGKITESPVVNKFYENTLAEMPFSGAPESYKAIAENLKRQPEELLGSIMEAPETGDVNELTKSLLLNAENHSRKIKNNLYNVVNAVAEKEGHKLDLTEFKDLANKYKQDLSSSPLLKYDNDVNSFIRKLGILGDNSIKEYGNIVNSKTGKPYKTKTSLNPPTITEANIVANALHKEGEKMTKNTLSGLERGMGRQYQALAGALRSDVKNSIKNTGSKRLQDAYNEATENYKNNYAQFLDKDLASFLDPNKKADAVVNEIVNPSVKNDKYSNINNIINLLPEEKKNILGYTYLANATDKDGILTPQAVNKQLNKLGRRQFMALFPDAATREKLKDFQKLHKMSSEASNMMLNPQTGKRALTLGNAAIETLGGLLGMHAGGAEGALYGVAAPIIAGRVASKYLTNPEVRKKLVQAMIKKDMDKINRIQ